MSNSDKGKKMSAFTLRIEENLIDAAKKKAGVVPISRVIRLLLRKWLRGEIELDYTQED